MRRETKIYLSEDDVKAINRTAQIFKAMLESGVMFGSCPSIKDLELFGDLASYESSDNHFRLARGGILDNVRLSDGALFLERNEE